MKNFEEYFINEKLSDELSDNIDNEYKSLKKGILELIEKTIDEPEKMLNVQNFIDKYIEGEETLNDFSDNESDIYEFYLKHQIDIDSLLSDEDFFDKNPSESNIYSLYDYLIEGTKESVNSCMKLIYDEVFKVD
jgi:hypothetical protein